MVLALNPLQIVSRDDELINGRMIINDALVKRNQAERRMFASILVAGRELERILPILDELNLPRQQWIVNNLRYTNPRAYQIDLAIWRSFSPFLDELAKQGIIQSADDIESASDNMTERQLHYSMHAIRNLTQQMSEGEREIAMTVGIEFLGANTLTIDASKKIVELSKVVNALPDGEMKDLAVTLMRSGNLNGSVINETVLEQIVANPDVKEQILSSGVVYVPGTERNVPVSDLSVTDVDIALGREAIETELANQTYWKSVGVGTGNRASSGHKVFVGNREHVLALLKEHLSALESDHTTVGQSYKVVVSVQP